MTVRHPIAIIGLGALMPKATSLASFWQHILDASDCIETVPASRWPVAQYFDPDAKARDKTYCRVGGFIPDIAFDPFEYGLPPTSLEVTDTAQLLSLVVARQALADAGYPVLGNHDHRRTACILGVAGTAMELVADMKSRTDQPVWEKALDEAGVDPATAIEVVDRIKSAFPEWNENAFPGGLANLVPGRIANRFDLGAASYAVDAACAGALCAVRLACAELARGDCDLALTGGVDTNNSILTYLSFSKTPALSPSERIRPFDSSGDGTVVSEGIGMLVLKRLDDARADGDRVYAVIRGAGASTDGRGSAIYAPRADGQIRAIRSALAEAEVPPETVGLLEAHATGTAVGDAVELEALLTTYGADRDSAGPAVLGSVKSQIGHTKSAAGAASLIKAALALHQRVLPPTIGVSQPLAKIVGPDAPMVLLKTPLPWPQPAGQPRRAGVSAFGFGGANYHVVLEEADAADAAPVQATSFSVLVSAADPAALSQSCRAVARAVAEGAAPADHGAGPVRVAVVARNAAELSARLEAAADPAMTDPDVVRPPAAAAGGLVAMFSGQGSQYVGMGARLAIDHPVFRQAVAAMNAAMAQAGQAGCDTAMFPLPRRGPESLAAQRKQLAETLYAQASVGAFSMGMHAILAAEGFKFASAIGHSFGELPALWAAGSLDDAAFAKLVVARGLSLTAPAGTDPGTLLAVRADLRRVEAVVAGLAGITIANINAPEQIVVGGAAEAVTAAEAVFAAAGIDVMRLPVSAGFHTPSVAFARAPWQAALDAVTPSAPAFPVYANTTGQAYPSDPAAVLGLLAGQPFEAVRFRDQVEAAYAAGGRVFLEIGPKAVLTRLVGEILAGRPHVAIATNQDPSTDSSLQLHRAIAQLKALGVPFTAPARRWAEGAGPPPPRSRTTVTLGAHGVVSQTSRRLQSRLAASAPVVKRRAAVAPAPVSAPVAVAHSLPIVSGGTTALSGIAGPAQLVQPLQSQVADNHREFLGGQIAIARALLSGAAVDVSVLGVLKDLQDKGAQLHEQYLRDQAEIAVRMLGAPSARPAAELPQAFAPVTTVSFSPAATAQPTTPALPPPPPPQVATPAPAPPASEPGAVLARLLDIVAEATGYPVDFIEPEMDLEADLGIDSIKRMQIFATFQAERPDAPVKALSGARSLAAIAALLEGGEPAAARQMAPGPDAGSVYAALRQIVSSKTGYPEDVLQPDMDLEADLGIDSVKRMEILAAASEQLGIVRERGGPQVRAAGTLTGMAEMLHRALGGEAVPVPVARIEPEPAPGALASGIAQARLVEQPIGTTAGSWLRGRVVLIVHDGGDETEAVVSALLQSGAVPVTLDLWPGVDALDVESDDRHHLLLTDASDAALGATFTRIAAMLGPVQGLVMLLPSPSGDAASHAVLARGLDLLRAACPVLEKAGGRLLAVTRLDGALGLERVALPQADIGGVAGAVKSAAQEWPAMTVGVLDIAPDLAPSEAIVAELAHMTPPADGIVAEIALAPGCRRTLRLAPAAIGKRATFGADELVLITGGGRGVTALCAQALARQTSARIVLMGRTPHGPAEPAWADGVAAAELRKTAGAWLRDAGQPATPREIEALCLRVLASRDLRANQALLQDRQPAIGYVSADLSDGAAVAQAMAGIVAQNGPVTAIVHGAGGLADRRIADIKPGDFASVFGPKVDGLSHVLAAVDPAYLRRVALFSSTAAYFGNAGQAVYAMANEILNKRTYALAAALPSARVVSLGWGPWDGGMVTPDLAERFRARGVGLLSAEAGTAAFMDLFLQDEVGAYQFVIGDPPGSPQAAPLVAPVAGALV